MSAYEKIISALIFRDLDIGLGTGDTEHWVLA